MELKFNILKYKEGLILFGVTCLALIAFSIGRTMESISGDEPFTIYFSQLNVRDFVPLLFQYNNIPPTFEWLLHWWMYFFGNDAATLRILPALFTALSAPAIYLIAKQSNGSLAGIMAASLFILSPFQMEWAHLLRSYSMMIFGTTWSMYFFLQFSKNKNKSALLGWIIFSTIATAGHYLAWLAIACEIIGFLSIPTIPARSAWKKLMGALAVLFIANIPFLYFLVRRFVETATEGTYVQSPEGFSAFFRELFRLFGGIELFPANPAILGSIWLGFPFLIVTFLLLFRWIRSTKHAFPSKFIGLWLYLPFVLMFMASYKIPMFVDRYLSFISPAIPLLIVAFIFSLPKKTPLVVGSLVILMYTLNFKKSAERFSHPDAIIASFKELKTPQNSAIWSPGYADLILGYHYSPAIFSDALNQKADTSGVKVVQEEGYTIHKEGFRRALQREGIFIANSLDLLQLDIKEQDEIVFVDAFSEYIYPNNGLTAALKAEFGNPIESYSFDHNVTVALYQRKKKLQ